MEEVIFNGSTSKKPRGMAEVTMTISGLNSPQTSVQGEDGEDPADVVSVARRLYRSGDSEYMLNRSQCRLKDIRDLFLDTGLEVKSYSILEQDRISEILNAKPLERRFLIEEVAGVMKYNVRKKEALSKLESSRTNLQRINDIIIEVKKQISFLDRLAKKAERYKKLTSEVHSIELRIAKQDYQSLKESFENIMSEHGVLKEEESLKKSDLSRIENETETKRVELLEKEKALEQIQIKFQELEKNISEIEKDIAVARSERDSLKEYLIKLQEQEEEFGKKEEGLNIRQGELEKSGADLLSEIEKQKDLLGDRADLVRSAEEDLAEKEDLIENQRKEIFRISEDLSNLRNSQSRLQSTLEGLKHRAESSVKDAESMKMALSELDASLKDLESNLLEKNNDILLLKERKGMTVEEISGAKNRLENLRETLSRNKEDLASYSSRVASLKELLFDDSTKEFLSEDLNLPLVAAISDIIETDDAYEKAVESVLSEKVNSFIVQSLEDVATAIARIKEKAMGRTALIPVDAPEDTGVTAVPEGADGRVLSFVRTEADFLGIAKNLFQNIFVVKDLKTALNLFASGHRLNYVTLDGDVVETSGAVITGEVKGIFRRKREIRELEGAIDDKKKKVGALQTEFGLTLTLIDSKEADLRNIEAALADKEKEISLLKLTSENYGEEKERRSRKVAYLSLEIEQTARERESVEKSLSEKNTEIDLSETKKLESERIGTSLQEEISQRKSSLDGRRTEVTDIRLAITSLKEKSEAIYKEKENIAREISENNRKKEFLSEEVSSIQSRILQREIEVKENEEKVRLLIMDADHYKHEISGRKEVIETENQDLFSVEHGLKILRGQIDSVSAKVSELDVQKAEHKLRMEGLYESIKQNYGLDLEVIEAEPLTEEDENRLIELRQKVQEMGPVNLGTLEEYEELRTRYEFLKNQQDDLHKSIAELEEAITRINVTTRKKLKESFEALKIKFSEVFLALFEGGRAELVMTDENNILETGIDIIAQPPGKRLQNINLLSGGEKTLTALSLLFASFLIKPTPLCILDEADSALDEANTLKFANMIKDFSNDTQFIVVTHNRNTMSVADYIYGITMEEAGISKVISMQLVEA
jgi:chromosome segregation protein